MAAVALFSASLLGFGGDAVAQSVDWVLNLNDTGSDPTAAGGTITYNINVSNNGADPAPVTTIDLDVPAGTTLAATSGTITGCAPVPTAGPATVTCTIPALAAGGAVDLSADVVPVASGTVTIGAHVPTTVGAVTDFDTANNDQTENTTITAGADVELLISGPATAASGSQISYSFDATNNGPDPASNLTLSFPIPTGVSNITEPPGCSLSASTYTCAVSGPLAPGASVSLVFDVQISAASGSTVTPVATISVGSPVDPLASNNTDSLDTDITAGTDLRITKSRSPSGTLLVGDTVTFTLAGSYTGDDPSGITITDTIPAIYAIQSVTPSAGSGFACTVTLQDISCLRATGAGPGGNVSLGSISIVATAITAGSAVNTATIVATGPVDSNLSNNSDTDGGATIQDPTVDLRANKSGPNPPLIVDGNSYDFSISATNIGNADFFGTIVLTDSLPAGLTATGFVLNGWTCAPVPAAVLPIAGPAVIECTQIFTSGSPLASGATTSSAVIQTTATASGTITNSVTVSSPDANIADSNSGNDVATTTVTGSTLGASADILVEKTASLATLPAGDVQTFTLRVVNNGPIASANITLTDSLSGLINNSVGPTGAGLISVDDTSSVGLATGLTCSTASSGGSSRLLTCTIVNLPVCVGADCPIITVQVRPGGNGGSRTNTADAISSVTVDSDLTNNSASATFTVEPRADMTVTKVSSPSPATAGQDLTYVLTARNISNGLSAAASVTITDTLPNNVTFVSASPSAGSCTTTPILNSTTGAGNNTVSCSLGTINNGAQRTVTIVTRPNFVTRGTTLSNNVTVATTTIETDGTNNSAINLTPVVVPVLDLLVNKTDSVDPVAVGDDTVFSISVQNIGPSAAENVVFTDVMPPSRLSFQSVIVSAGGSCLTVPAVDSFGQTLECDFPRLLAGTSETITVTMRGTEKGTVFNTADVTSDEVVAGFDTNTTNNNVMEQTTVRSKADPEVVSKVASVNPVNLRDNFNFVITVRNNSGAGLAEADDVLVSDTLPTGMVLTGPPTVTAGLANVTGSTCTGLAGETSFTCDLGTFTGGGTAEITVPVEITSVSSNPQTIVNTASITTSSLDVNSANNTNSGSVDVNSSSISGSLFRDFTDDGAITAGDTGIGAVTMTLTGTSADGAAISRTVATAADGTFTFALLPEGNYTITRGTPSEPNLVDGTDTPGTAGGTVSAPITIAGISLGGNTAAANYLFALIPQASIGIAKTVQSGPTPNADGSYNVTFRLTVENLSLEALENIVVDDALAGASPLFGAFSALATPATDPLARGSYTILAAPSGSCGGLQAGFDGNAAQTVATGFGLAIGATCTIDLILRVQPSVPFPPVLASGGRYENQATVDGQGAVTGQTSATNAQLADSSDNGVNPDPNSNSQANEAGENDPTPVDPVYVRSVGLVKTVDTGALSTPAVAGDILTFGFTVTNTGDVTLTGLTLADPLPGISVSGGPIASLTPGASDSLTFTATYTLTQADVDAGQVVNQATVSGIDPFDGTVTDPSGTTTTNDTPLTTTLTPGPAIGLVKTANASGLSSPSVVGERITYSFAVTNTGNVTLSNVTLTDILPGIVISGGPIATLAPGATDATTFTATYDILQSDIDAGQVSNQATATGSPPFGADVNDLSGTTTGNDTPTVSSVTQAPAIDLQKTADDSAFLVTSAVPGDTLPFTFQVTNIGNTTLTGITITDPLPGIVITGGPIASLAPGATDSTTISGSYSITAADILAGQIDNTATTTGTYTDSGGSPQTVTDTDSATGIVVAIDANPEIFPPFTTDGGTTTSMLASDSVANQPATLANVTISVVTTDPELTLDPATGLITLAPGNPAGEYFVTYQICSTASPAVCDTAIETVTQSAIPSIEATKTQVLTDNGDGIDGVGDTLTYTITVENTGNVPVENIALTDTLTTLNTGFGLTLDGGPTFVSASSGSLEGDLAIGETATYTASFTLTIDALIGGGTSNTITVDALPVFGPAVPGTPAPILDVSDDGDDGDGNTTEDPTQFPIASSLAASGLTVTKTTPRGIVERGQIVPYTIAIRNDNPVVSGQLDIVDVLPPGFLYLDGSATLDGTPFSVDVAGRVVTWPDVPVPPLTTVTATLSARITTGAPSGELVNRASARNPNDNTPLAPVATATVRILPEAVFDCGDVIGKVFDDRDRDGYQNPDRSEPGIPGVRLVGIDGTTIVTDEFGRFHVPCAMLPDDRGTNFILKIDPHSLPAGYGMTSENPRIVRLTRGKLTEMNFGATAENIVRIDQNARVFVPQFGGQFDLIAARPVGLSALVDQIALDPQRPTEIRAMAAGIDIRFDTLDERRFLNVTTMGLRAAYRAGETVIFRTSSNYPRFIVRSEIRIRDRSHRRLIAVLPVLPNGQMPWMVPQSGTGEFDYVLRVYDGRGRYDETEPLSLVRTARSFNTHETVRGAAIAPGEGEDRTAIRNIPIRGGLVTAAGEGLAPGTRVLVMSEEVTVDLSGRFVVSRILPVGEHEVAVDVAHAGQVSRVVRNIEVPALTAFSVGIVDLTIGKQLENDLADADPDYDDTYAEGRLGYYGTAILPDGTRVTMSVDTGNGSLKDAFRRLDDRDPRDVLQRLDEDDLYPTYGDDSTAYDDAPTSGRAYFQIERGGARLTWGDFQSAIAGPEFLAGKRNLYGVDLNYTSPVVTTRGDARAQLSAYFAQPDTLPARDIMRGTGGSVYFLSRQDINNGSETVTVQIRDPQTGRIISTTTLVADLDYDINNIQGVIVLAAPLASSTTDGGLISSGVVGEFDVNLVVQYEYTPTAGDLDGASGAGRVELWARNNLRLGITGMRENTGVADQDMFGADLRWNLGETSYVETEFAQTVGPGFGRTLSANGGLTLDMTGPGTGTRADALRVDGHLNFAELNFGLEGHLDFYYERKDAGFATLNEDIAEDRELVGLSSELALSPRLRLGIDVEDFQKQGREHTQTSEVRASYSLNRVLTLSGAVEYLDQRVAGDPNETGQRTDAAVRLDYVPSPDLRLYGFGQSTVDVSGQLQDYDRGGFGFNARVSEKVDLALEASDGSTGLGGNARLTYRPTPDDEVYLGYVLDPNRTAPTNNLSGAADNGTFVMGRRVQQTDSMSYYGEHKWDLWGDRRSIARTFGVSYTPDARWSVSGAIENGEVRDEINGDFDRTAVSLGLGYGGEGRVDARLRIEYRVEDGETITQDRETWALLGGLNYRVSDDWRALASVDTHISQSDQSAFLDGEFVEAIIGYAYRPVDNERLNVLFRYRYLYDLPGPDQVTADGSTDGPSQVSHVLSVDGNYDLTRKLTVGAKYGYRLSQTAPRGTQVFSDATAQLAVLRADWHVVHKWDILAEGRTLISEEIDTTEYGALTGVYRHLGNSLKIGLGYEWGQVSDDMANIDYQGQGVFLNLLGKF